MVQWHVQQKGGTSYKHVINVYSKTCVKRPLSKRQKIDFQDQLSLNAGPRGAFFNTFDLHCAPLWNPYTDQGKRKIEMVQHRSALYVTI